MDHMFELEEIVSIAMIREHTKTDDVPQVTDGQITMYRSASFEAANMYTGRFWDRNKSVTEPVTTRRKHKFQHNLSYITKYPVMDGNVLMHGVFGRFPLQIGEGRRKVKLPISDDLVMLENCCSPCHTQGNNGNFVTYQTGIRNIDEVPDGVILGILKYTAWSMANPGNEIMTVRNRLGISDSGELIGTNNGAWASGAIEIWRMYGAKKE